MWRYEATGRIRALPYEALAPDSMLLTTNRIPNLEQQKSSKASSIGSKETIGLSFLEARLCHIGMHMWLLSGTF